MSGLPVLSGAVQLTERLVLLPETGETVGGSGANGGSFTSVSSICTKTASVPPLASSTLTWTMSDLFAS